MLHVATWNINGLAPNALELETFLKTNKVDACLISEAHTTHRSKINVPEYNIYFTCHPDGGAHAGSAIAIKSSIKHCLLQEFSTDYLQATSVRLEDRCGQITLSAIYCPPRHTIKESQFTEFFNTLGNRFIAGGDWNAKHTYWGARTTVTRGRELKKSVDVNRLTPYSTGEPTYWPTDNRKIPDLLDFFITKNISNLYVNVKSSLDGSSDHTPVLLMLSTTVIYRETNNDNLHNFKTDWLNFQDYLNTNINLNIPLNTPEDIDDACMYLTNLIQVAAWKNTPELTTPNKSSPIPIELRNQIAEKRRLRRVWQLSRNREDKTTLNHAIVELKTTLAEIANDSLKRKLETLTPNNNGPYNLWKATKSMAQPQQCLPPIRSGTTWARTDSEKSELFAAHLAEVFKPNDTDCPENPEIDRILRQDFQLSPPLRPTSPAELRSEISTLKLNKAPGYDLITPKILKELPRKCLVFLTNLCNATFRTLHFPTPWKMSQIVMIHKPGKPANEVTSYRPISLTPILSKLWERIILARLKPHLEDNKVIPDHQFGFRKNHSTVEQVHRVYNTIRTSLEKREYCSSAFLDIQQAFDRVWHKGLLCKIKRTLPYQYYHLMSSYLDQRMFQVKQNCARSSFQMCRAGVPQGSVLGPVLYNIFTHDLPQEPNVTVATFADDAAFLSSSSNPVEASRTLQAQLNLTNDWLLKWRVKASAPKSNHITFTLRKKLCPTTTLGDVPLPQTTCVKYLGFHLDQRMTWKQHIKHKRDDVNNRFRNLLWLLGRQSTLSLANKLRVYSSIIKPIWTYGIQLWSTASKSNIQSLQRAQNAILRTISGAAWYTRNTEIHEYLNMRTVDEEAKLYSSKYKKRLEKHPNPLTGYLLQPNEIRRLKRANILLD